MMPKRKSHRDRGRYTLYIDWIEFPKKVKDYIINNTQWYENREVPQPDVLSYIQKEWKCAYQTAWEKLRLLVSLDPELEFKRNLKWAAKEPFGKPLPRVLLIYRGKRKPKRPWK